MLTLEPLGMNDPELWVPGIISECKGTFRITSFSSHIQRGRMSKQFIFRTLFISIKSWIEYITQYDTSKMIYNFENLLMCFDYLLFLRWAIQNPCTHLSNLVLKFGVRRTLYLVLKYPDRCSAGFNRCNNPRRWWCTLW